MFLRHTHGTLCSLVYALCLFEKVKQETSCALGLHLYNTALTPCKRLGDWNQIDIGYIILSGYWRRGLLYNDA